MTGVLFTTDVEIWCDGWQGIDAKFPEAFRHYIYGPTSRGDRGVAYQLKVLNDHGLKGVFFVEPLFALRFGNDPLAEIVGLITESGQEVQLHMHTEWVDEALEKVFPLVEEKRQHLRYFTLEEQKQLIGIGKSLLERVGAPSPIAFRAGSFAFNSDTLLALAFNGIRLDSSFNACQFGLDSGVCQGRRLFQPFLQFGVREYPMTIYQDKRGGYRHAQLGACSFRELEGLLQHAADQEWEAVVLLSHGFELLNKRKSGVDSIVNRRFLRLCNFLEKNAKNLETMFFSDAPVSQSEMPQPAMYRSPFHLTGLRIIEQVVRRWQ